ncbi:MAG TPA: signal peptide peptidase SppA [Rubrobacteraceae bacterium]|nr:signal peptide peptidase SppA [Rubrobacteraceae bacterium]
MEAGSGQDREHNTHRETAGNPPGDASGGSGPPPGTPPRRRRWRGFLIGGAIALGLLFLTAGTIAVVLVVSLGDSGGGTAVAPPTFQEEYVSGEGDAKIAVVPVEGVIGSQETTGALGTPAATPETLRDQLTQAAEDEDVEAVIVEVNSPGGGVVASDEMHQSILDFKEGSDKPVVVSMDETAASGGYYIATAADSIVANETTLTGSLGVIFSYLNYGEAADRLGLEEEVIKSGQFKDIGSPTREPTEEEREILQDLVMESYDGFVEVIVEGRDLPEDRVRELADGRIYSGLQAQELDLVDELGNLDTAARVSRRLADVEEATVVRYRQEPSLVELFQARLASTPESEALQALEAAGLSLTPELQYLYRP